MKKSVMSLVQIVIAVLSCLLLASCSGVSGGETPMDTAAALKMVNSGSQGVETTPVTNYPPTLIYDQNELIVLLEVANRGNHDLQLTDCFVQITGFDPNIISGMFSAPQPCALNLGTLDGKNIYNVQGSVNQLEFRSNDISLPDTVFEYNPTLNFVTCYNYHTTANPTVCVDPLFYDTNSQQKTCIPTDVGMGGGQGAPVSVSYVGVDMVGGKAVFEINVVNGGTGKVIGMNDLGSCTTGLMERTEMDKALYTVQWSGGPLDCKPRDGIVRLVNNNGKILCTANNLPVGPAFETPLMIELDYNYMQSFTRQVRIVKTPQ